MELFPERLVSELAGLPGGTHTYLRQICAADGVEVRSRLQRVVDTLGPPMDERAAELLGSLDNLKFFQGFAEVATLWVLHRAGWRLRSLHPPGPRLELRAPDGRAVFLSVLAFVHQTRPGGDEAARARFIETLNRIPTTHRFAVLVRRWLPHSFDPEPVRRAVEYWLRQVDRGRWAGRYAAFDDEHISLEFGLTQERVPEGGSPVALSLGPFLAHRTLEVVEPRVVKELDRHFFSPHRAEPVLVAAVADQPWALTPGYIREFLYGRPAETRVEEDGFTEVYRAAGGVSVFRDPLYAGAAGLILVDRRAEDAARVRARAWLNPWSPRPLPPTAFPIPTFADGEAARGGGPAGERVLRWWGAGRGEVDFG